MQVADTNGPSLPSLAFEEIWWGSKIFGGVRVGVKRVEVFEPLNVRSLVQTRHLRVRVVVSFSDHPRVWVSRGWKNEGCMIVG